MNRRAARTVFALGLLATVSAAAAQGTVARKYRLPDHGYIELQVPRSWRDDVRQPPGRLPPTIVFTPPAGSSFQILLTPMFSVRDDVSMPSPAQIKATVARTAAQVKRRSVEKDVAVKELKGPSAIGYYFSVTDRAPRPEEYKYMTQGILRAGELMPTFTILTNDGADAIVVQALAMLQSARPIEPSRGSREGSTSRKEGAK